MRQVFRTTKSIQVLPKADFHVLEMFPRVFHELATTLSFVLEGAYTLLTVSSGGMKKQTGLIFRALETSSSNEVLFFPRGAFRQPAAKQKNDDHNCAP